MPKSIRKRRSLITSPLAWQMNADPVAPPVIPVLAEHGGTQLQTPQPVLLVDTREQVPLDFSRFQGWFAGMERKALELGDYSIAGMEEICIVERKELPDLVHFCTTDRRIFTNRLRRMVQCPHRLLLITSSLSQIKSPYSHGGSPNRITQSLIAMLGL
jgi:ERCC4-type nuclease